MTCHAPTNTATCGSTQIGMPMTYHYERRLDTVIDDLLARDGQDGGWHEDTERMVTPQGERGAGAVP